MENNNIKLQNAIDKISKQIEFPEVKQIGENIYEYRCGDHVIRGNKQGIEDIDRELLKMIKKL